MKDLFYSLKISAFTAVVFIVGLMCIPRVTSAPPEYPKLTNKTNPWPKELNCPKCDGEPTLIATGRAGVTVIGNDEVRIVPQVYECANGHLYKVKTESRKTVGNPLYNCPKCGTKQIQFVKEKKKASYRMGGNEYTILTMTFSCHNYSCPKFTAERTVMAPVKPAQPPAPPSMGIFPPLSGVEFPKAP